MSGPLLPKPPVTFDDVFAPRQGWGAPLLATRQFVIEIQRMLDAAEGDTDAIADWIVNLLDNYRDDVIDECNAEYDEQRELEELDA